MGELRDRGSERLEEEHVLRRVRDVIVAPHDVRDLHIHVVGDDGQVIRRLTVRSQDDEVLDVGVVERNRPMNEVGERGPAVRHLESNRPRRAGGVQPRDFGGRQRAAGAIVNPAAARRFGGRALRLDLFRRAVAVVRPLVPEEPLGSRPMPVEPL